jgi:hypothetical protein
LFLEEKNDCYLENYTNQRQAQQLLQSSTNTNYIRPLYRVNEVLIQDFEDRINEEVLVDSLQDIHLDANNAIEIPVDLNNDIDVDVNDENENLLVVNNESILLDSNLFHGINGISSLEKLEDIKYYKEFLDCNSSRAKHTLYLVLEIINQNRKDNFLKLKNDIYTKPFLDGCNINTIDFISNFKTILDSNGANIKLCNELFNFLRVSLPDSSLNEVVKYCGTNNITRNITDFMCSNNKIISIDICPVNNCMSFHEDTNTLTYCTLCHSRRFTKCSKRNCITKSYDECEHSLQERIPVKCIYYIPIIPKLVEIIQSKNFKHYYDYTFNTPLINNNIYSDSIHGNNSQQHALPKMNSKGNKFHEKYVTEYLPRNRTMIDRVEVISLLLSYFYDSALLFKRSNESLSILNVTIINFPYQIRHTIGAGTFLVALHKSLSNDLAQKVIFRQLFSDELNILEKRIFY